MTDTTNAGPTDANGATDARGPTDPEAHGGPRLSELADAAAEDEDEDDDEAPEATSSH